MKIVIQRVKSSSIEINKKMKNYINLFHSIFEDTTILMLLGPSLMVILLVRGVFVFLLTYFLIKVFDFLPIKTYEKLLYSKPILRTAQSSNFS